MLWPDRAFLRTANAEWVDAGLDFESPEGDGPALVLVDDPLVRALFAAVMGAGPGPQQSTWRPGAAGVCYSLRASPVPVGLQLEAPSVAEAWDVLGAMTPLNLDVLALIIGRMGESGRPGPIFVRAAELLQIKGVRRWGDERRALERRIAAEVQTLRRLSLSDTGELLFQLTPVGEEQCDFVCEPARRLWQAMSRGPSRGLDWRIVRFDHRANRAADVLAKKLGLHLSLAVPPGARVVRCVGALLRGIGFAEPALRSGRLVDRLEEALLRLEDNGLFAFRYRGSKDGLYGGERVKGCLKRWLAAELQISRLG